MLQNKKTRAQSKHNKNFIKTHSNNHPGGGFGGDDDEFEMRNQPSLVIGENDIQYDDCSADGFSESEDEAGHV